LPMRLVIGRARWTQTKLLEGRRPSSLCWHQIFCREFKRRNLPPGPRLLWIEEKLQFWLALDAALETRHSGRLLAEMTVTVHGAIPAPQRTLNSPTVFVNSGTGV